MNEKLENLDIANLKTISKDLVNSIEDNEECGFLIQVEFSKFMHKIIDKYNDKMLEVEFNFDDLMYNAAPQILEIFDLYISSENPTPEENAHKEEIFKMWVETFKASWEEHADYLRCRKSN